VSRFFFVSTHVFMASYRKLKVHEVGTDTYIDYEYNVSFLFTLKIFDLIF